MIGVACRPTFARHTRRPTADRVTSQIAELYAGPWEDFVRRRTELATAIRSSGDRVAAKTVAGLRKPTRGAWLVNLLVHRETDQVAEVLELGESLARAHRDADPDELRRLSSMRTAVIDSLAKRAAELGAEQGYQATDAVRQEVAETIQAAMADPALADRVLEGALVATVRAAGFGPADLFAPALADVIPIRAAPAPGQSAPAPGPSAPAPDPAEVRRLERERGRAEGRLEEAQERLEREQRAEEELRTYLATAGDRLAELDERVDELSGLLAAVTRERDQAEARRAELARSLAERTAGRETIEADVARLLALIDQVTERLGELGVTD